MANVLVDENTLHAIASAVRSKDSSKAPYTFLPREIPSAILSLNGNNTKSFKSIKYNKDDTITLTDVHDLVYTIRLNFEQGVLCSLDYWCGTETVGKPFTINIKHDIEGNAYQIGETKIDLKSAPDLEYGLDMSDIYFTYVSHEKPNKYVDKEINQCTYQYILGGNI